MTAIINYSGVRQGMLYISHRVVHGTRKNHETLWRCTCDCGETVTLTSNQLRRGREDCGCLVPIVVKNFPGRKTKNRSPTVELKLHPLIDEFLYKFWVPDYQVVQ